MNCPVCRNPMRRYENPGRWICTNIKAHDAANVRAGRFGSAPKAVKAGGWRKKKK